MPKPTTKIRRSTENLVCEQVRHEVKEAGDARGSADKFSQCCLNEEGEGCSVITINTNVISNSVTYNYIY